ncbi:MAG: DUF2202 domain-containing protein [Pseudolabrys sp.]|jgi:hypothetical protein
MSRLPNENHVDAAYRTYEALCEAIDGEYKARATYRAVITAFGPVRPFSNIVFAEQRHIDALLTQFRRLELEPPSDHWDGQVAAPPSLAEACRLGVQSEIDNAALYDRLVAMTEDRHVLAVLAALRKASAERHLPAFTRCMQRGGRCSGRRRNDARHDDGC